MVFSLSELLFLLIASFVVGIIFSDTFDNVEIRNSFLIALLSFGLHEIAHKITAIALGYNAVINYSLFGLLLGLFLKYFNSPIIIFIPGYVSIYGNLIGMSKSLVAFSGPFVNFLLYIISNRLLKKPKMYTLYYIGDQKYFVIEKLNRINYWLFFLNMIPIPPLDGFKVVQGIFESV